MKERNRLKFLTSKLIKWRGSLIRRFRTSQWQARQLEDVDMKMLKLLMRVKDQPTTTWLNSMTIS